MSEPLNEVVRLGSALLDQAIAGCAPLTHAPAATLGLLALGVGAAVAWRVLGPVAGATGGLPGTVGAGWAADDAVVGGIVGTASAPGTETLLGVTTPGGGE